MRNEYASENQNSLGNPPVNRRKLLQFMGAGLLYGLSELAILKAASEYAERVQYKNFTWRIPNLDPKWNDSYIVHLTDCHVGYEDDLINVAKMAEITKTISGLLRQKGAKPHKTFVINTGDIASIATLHEGRPPSRLSDVDQSLAHILAIPALMSFQVPGNHDILHAQTAELFNLINQHDVSFSGLVSDETFFHDSPDWPFALLTTPDYTEEHQWYESDIFVNALQKAQAMSHIKPIVWATHNASPVDVAQNGLAKSMLNNTLVLAGHTHGGHFLKMTPLQMMAEAAALYKIGYKSEYVDGIYPVGENSAVLVSEGLGTTRILRDEESQVGIIRIVRA